MLLSSNPLALDCQLSWLLSTDPHVAVGHCLQPRAVCLPLAQQQALTLSASLLLQATDDANKHQLLGAVLLDGSAAPAQIGGTRNKLLQLLEVMANSNSMVGSWRTSIQQTATMALQQQQQPSLHQYRQLAHQCPAAAPCWLSSSPQQHCFSWLTPRDGTAASTSTAADTAQPAHNTAEAAQGVACDTHMEGEGAAATTTAAAAGYEDLPAAKRRKQLEPAAAAPPAAAAAAANPGAYVQPGNAAGVGDAEPADLEAALPRLLEQLQELDNTCDTSQIDLQLLQRALVTAAAAGPSQLEAGGALQQQLQHLSVDALQPLLHELLLANNSNGSTQNGHSAGGAFPANGLACLLAAAVLPRLQQLDSAAPKALLLCLVTVAQAQADVLVPVVLQPLLTRPGLLAVQVQLLVKLMKEVPALQPRLLQLLLLAALGSQVPPASLNTPSLQPLAFTPLGAMAGYSCCWSESHAVLMRGMLHTCPQVVNEQLDDIITALKAAAQQPALAKSNAFGQLLMALAKNYAAVMSRQQVVQLQTAAAATSTFMTKALISKLQQLAAQHAAAAAAVAAPMQQ